MGTKMKVLSGLILCFLIGVVCRLTDIPLPAPTALLGALLVVAMALGYSLTDRLAQHRLANHEKNCAGSNGKTRG